MVEANGPTATANDAAEQTISFFDTIFDAVPPVYRQVDKEYLDDAPQATKNGKKPSKKKNVSLLELNEMAHERVEEIRRANALKSQQKIKELTKEHQKNKSASNVGISDEMEIDQEESKDTSKAK